MPYSETTMKGIVMTLFELCEKRDEVLMADFITEKVRTGMVASLEKQIYQVWNAIPR